MGIKRNLVIAAVGDESLHKCWFDEDYHIDSCLIYYGDDKNYEGDCTYYRTNKGSKYHLIKDAIEDICLDEYEFIWLPDDDIFLSPEDLRKLFRFMKNYNLQISQPSIMGWYNIEMTTHRRGSLLRYTNWVEIMCPCFSRDALLRCKGTFDENESSWSIETIWNVLLDHPKDKIAIIDDVIAIHTRMAGTRYSTEEYLKEAAETYKKHDLGREMEKDLEHGEAIESEVYAAVIYNQIMKDMEYGVERSERFWPPNEKIKELIGKTDDALKDIRPK